MQRRILFKAAAAVRLAAGTVYGRVADSCSGTVAWNPIHPVPAGIPALDGQTDTVPDIVGRLGVPINLAIFSEDNQFPALLGGEVIEPLPRPLSASATGTIAFCASNPT